MIQRIQSIWLLLASVAAFSTLKLSFYSGNIVDANQVKTFTSLTAVTNLLILVLTVVVAVAAFIAIFLYKNRPLQLRITLATAVIAFLNIFLYYRQTQKFAEGNYDLTAVLTLVVPILLLLAARAISKDQKLVKSLDRLR
ncbi:MAG: DUF4293 domain-containing protein [Bacteroidota bacterium]|nr:DUF4293 domain-containing protein [Bacteroidota bacterium]